jgi:hypothetical protein
MSGVPGMVRGGTEGRVQQRDESRSVLPLARASERTTDAAFPVARWTPYSLIGICLPIGMGSPLEYLRREEEEQGEQREESGLAGSEGPNPRTPLGGYTGRNGEERAGSAWAHRSPLRPRRPITPRARVRPVTTSTSVAVGLPIRSVLVEPRLSAMPWVFLSDLRHSARSARLGRHRARFSARSFGCDNRAECEPLPPVQSGKSVRSVGVGEGVGVKTSGFSLGPPPHARNAERSPRVGHT